MNSERAKGPDWGRLFETAAAQEGHFTTLQAQEAGYSPQLLVKYLRSGKVTRIRRGIYRLRDFPSGEQEELVTAWLWADRAGIFSHETALMLHNISDALPARVHLTLPESWRNRRLRVPEGVSLHHADVGERDRAWVGVVPVTSVRRTLADCAVAPVTPDLVEQAIAQALTRGLVSGAEAAEVERTLYAHGWRFA